MNIVFVSGFLSPRSKGGPALRAKNSLAVMQQLGNVRAFDLETISRFSWSGGETRPTYRTRQVPWVIVDSVSKYFYTAISRLLQIIEIFTQLVSVSAYFKLSRFIQDASPDIVWFSFASNYPRLFVSLKRRFPSIPFVADTDAVVSTHLKRAAENMSGIKALVYGQIAKEKKRHENLMMRAATVTTAVSDIDLAEYSSRSESFSLALFPNVVALNSPVQDLVQRATAPTVLITGTFGGPESAMTHGTLWFLREVLPEVMGSVPNVVTNIVGRNASRILEFGEVHAQVKIHSDVASLDPFFAEAWCSICPLFFESGTRFKILEASERGIPTVSTTLGAEGLDFLHEKEILIGDAPKEFAALTIRILKDQDLRRSIGAHSRKKVVRIYSIEAGEIAAKRILDSCLTPGQIP